MNEHEISINKTCRYYTHGNITTAKYIWFALHGYGQLSKYFIKNFEHLNEEDHFIIAPEGFHRFYLNGLSGRVGASWMTKEARETDIEDYVLYLDLVYKHAVEKIRKPNQKLIAFGFSQGVATISRWIVKGNVKPDIAVFWAGSFPPDLKAINGFRWFDKILTIGALGNDDEFIDDRKLKDAKIQYASLGIEVDWFKFEGGHKIPHDAIQNLVNQYL